MGLQSHFRSANYKLQCKLLLIISGKKKKKQTRVTIARRKREAMTNLEKIKQC